MISQTLALFLDAYRELNSRKLFWVTLGLSLLVVLIYASFGVTEEGLTLLHWQFDTPWFTSELVPPEKFYLFVFAALGVPIWLTWAQTILALVSTASIFPDFVAGGSIELLLCRPIGRARLFLTKFATGLLFVGLQVLVFSAACFLVIGIRGDAWRPSIFLAVPIVLAFFSYLFAICALLGLLTRSAIAALLLTILVWFGLFIVNAADENLLMAKVNAQVEVERIEKRVDQQQRAAQARLDELSAAGGTIRDESGALPLGADDELEAANPFLHRTREELVEARDAEQALRKWHGRVTAVKTVLPKTSDTINLLGRALLSPEDTVLIAGAFTPDTEGESPDQTIERMEAASRDRSLWWILGTSFLFEAAVLGVGVWAFSRRDF